MKKKIIIYLIIATLPTVLTTTNNINIRALQDEFARVGIYNPQSPELYNEQRAAELLKQLDTKYYRTLGQALRKEQLESLQRRPATDELHRLQQENQQLRNQINALEDERRRRPADNCQEQLRLCRERLQQFAELASRTITGLNEFERLMIAAGHELESSAAWGISTPENREQRIANARQFIDAGRTQVQGLNNLRNSLEALLRASR